MSQQAQAFIDQANQAIQDGRLEEALALADQALEHSPGSGEAQMVRGIVLAQTGQPAGATAAFREAIRLMPQSAKAFYNFAAHQYRQGEKQESLAMAREALRLEPGNAAASDLVKLIEGELGVPPSGYGAPGPVEAPSGTAFGSPYGAAPAGTPYVRPGYENPAGALPFVSNLGGKWDAIGWTLSILSLAVTVGMILYITPMMGSMFSNASDPEAMQRAQTDFIRNAGIGYTLVNILSWVGWLGMVVWAVMDIVHRRTSWAWLLGFVCCFQFIIGPLYLVTSRK